MADLSSALSRRTVLGGGGLALLAACGKRAATDTGTLYAGDQKGGSKVVLTAAGKLTGLPYRIEWSSFPNAAPLLEALNAGAIDTGIGGRVAEAQDAAVRLLQPAKQAEQGALAAAAAPNHCEKLPGRDVKVEIGNDAPVAEGLRQAPGGDGQRARTRRCRRARTLECRHAHARPPLPE